MKKFICYVMVLMMISSVFTSKTFAQMPFEEDLPIPSSTDAELFSLSTMNSRIADYSILSEKKGPNEISVTINRNIQNVEEGHKLCFAEYDKNNNCIDLQKLNVENGTIQYNSIPSGYRIDILVLDYENGRELLSDCILPVYFDSDVSDVKLNIQITNEKREKSVKFSTEDYTSDSDLYDSNKMKFISGNEEEEFNINDNVLVVLNGVETDISILRRYNIKEYNGTIELVDRMEQGSTSFDGVYDIMKVDLYSYAVIDSVIEKSDSYVLYFSEIGSLIRRPSYTIDKSNKNVKFIKNGDNATVSDVNSGDVLTFKFDLDAGLELSENVEITINNTVINDTVQKAEYKNDRWVYTIDNKEYKLETSIGDNSQYDQLLYVGNKYIMKIDAFGKIVSYEVDCRSINLGVIDSVTDDEIRVIDKYGITQNFSAIDNNIVLKAKDIAYSSDELKPLSQRIVEYELYQGSVSQINYSESMTRVVAKYSKSNNTLGTYCFGEDTKLINMSKAVQNYGDFEQNIEYKSEDILPFDTSSFIDGEIYTMYVSRYMYEEISVFGIIVDGNTLFGADEPFSIVSSISTGVCPVDNKEHKVISLVTSDRKEAKDYFVLTDVYTDNLQSGDAIVFGCRSDGFIEKIEKIFSANELISDSNISAEKIFQSENNLDELKSNVDIWDYDADVKVNFGIITGKYDNILELSKVRQQAGFGYTVDGDSTQTLIYDDDVNIYVYDMANPSDKIYKGNEIYLMKSIYGLDGDFNCAFAKTYKGVTTDIYVIGNYYIKSPDNIKADSIFDIGIQSDYFNIGKKIKIYSDVPVPKNAKTVIALYNKNNFVQMKTVDSGTKYINLENLPTYDSIKAFTIDSTETIRPLSCVAKTSNIVAKNLDIEIDTDTSDFPTDCVTISNNNILDASDIEIKAYDSDLKEQTYYLSQDLTVFVNGYRVNNHSLDLIRNESYKNIKLSDKDKDGKYDAIFVDLYRWAVVDGLSENTIYFSISENGLKGININTNDKLSYSITKNGEDINISDIKKNDILLLQYDEQKGFSQSQTVKILVCDNIINGEVTATGEDNNGKYYYTVNDKNYYMGYKYDGLYRGSEYILYLDPFDRIIYYEECATDDRLIGIFDFAFRDSSDIPKIRIITSSGEKVSYPVKDNSISRFMEFAGVGYTTVEYYYGSLPQENLKPLEQRVVEYRIDSSGYITYVQSLYDAKRVNGEYNRSINSIESVALSNKATVIDLSSIENYGIRTGDSSIYDVSVIDKKNISELQDGSEYSIIAANKSSIDGRYGYIILLSGGVTFSAKTPIAVCNSEGSAYDSINGYTVTTLDVYTNGEQNTTELRIAPWQRSELKNGDVFVYSTDSDGYVDEIIPIFTGISSSGYNYFVERIKDARQIPYSDFYSYSSYGKSIWDGITSMPYEWANTTENTKNGNVEILFGVITDKNRNNISVSQIENSNNTYFVDIDASKDYLINDDVNVYVYDYSKSNVNDRLYTGCIADIIKSRVPVSEMYYENNGNYAFSLNDDNGDYRELNYIFAKLVDGNISECFVISGLN